jgi:5-methylcytosine-specific restriction endonuclease McrA
MTPLSIIPLRRSMTLDLYSDRVTALSYYADSSIRSESISHRIPAVMMCVNYVNATMVKRPTKRNIRLRDDNKCAYCGSYLTKCSFSIDHVIPKSRFNQSSAANTWKNQVACCIPCNLKKGDRTPEEAGMTLLIIPKKVHGIVVGSEIPNEWIPYLG